MEKITYLQLYVQHCRVEALVNDIVIQRKYEKNITTIAQPIHEFLVAGENTLSLNILPYVGTEFEPTAQVHLRIACFNEGDFLEFTGGELWDLLIKLGKATVTKKVQGGEWDLSPEEEEMIKYKAKTSSSKYKYGALK
jgi:hypothetical protein